MWIFYVGSMWLPYPHGMDEVSPHRTKIGITVEYAARFWVALHFRPISIDWFETLELDDDVNWLIYWLHHTIKLEMYILRLKHMFRLLTFALIRFFSTKKNILLSLLCFSLHNLSHENTWFSTQHGTHTGWSMDRVT